ncbi:Uncharacterised protein [uncultured archaeon]|nr:Uncharacterised protein [uncultured archaeon]
MPEEKETLITKISKRLGRGTKRRFRNRIIEGPIIKTGVAAGGAMGIGAIASPEQSWKGYILSGLKSVYEIPERIYHTITGAEKVVESAKDIQRAIEPAQKDLENLIGSTEKVKEGLKQFSPGDIIHGGKEAIDNALNLRGSGEHAINTIQQHGEEVTKYVQHRVGDLADMVQHTLHNLSEDPARALTAMGLFTAAGALGGYAIAKRVKKAKRLKRIVGEEDTTLGEDAIYGGKVLMTKLSDLISLGIISYNLGKESLYSKAKLVGEQVRMGISETMKHSGEVSSGLGDYVNKGKETVKLVKDIGKNIYNYFTGQPQVDVSEHIENIQRGGRSIESIINSADQTIESIKTTLEHVERAPDLLKDTPGMEKYLEFLRRTPEGIEKLYDLGRQVAETGIHPEQIRNSYGPVAEMIANAAVNIYQHPAESLGMVATVGLIGKAAPQVVSYIANTAHDYLLARKERKKKLLTGVREKVREVQKATDHFYKESKVQVRIGLGLFVLSLVAFKFTMNGFAVSEVSNKLNLIPLVLFILALCVGYLGIYKRKKAKKIRKRLKDILNSY